MKSETTATADVICRSGGFARLRCCLCVPVAGVAAVVCLAASAAGPAPAPSAGGLGVRIRADASAVVTDEKGRELCEIVLKLAPLSKPKGGSETKVLPSFGRGPARVVFGDRALLLSARTREIGGGILIDFRTAPARRDGGDAPWYEPLEIRAGVAAKLPGATFRGARGFLAGRYVALVAEEGAAADPSSPDPGEKEPFSAKAWGRGLRLAPEQGRELVIEGELPGEIKLDESDGGDFALRLAATEADTATPLAFAVFVCRWAYEGRPVLLEEPRVTFLQGLGCFEVIVRAFGRWRDPFDPQQATVEAAWHAGTSQGKAVPGFYGRDFRAVVEEAEDGSTRERLVPLGWPRFRSRLPEAVSGGRAVAVFVTKSGSSGAEVAVPSSRLWLGAEETRDGRASSGVTLGSSRWRSSADAARAIFALKSARVRVARLPVYEGAYALEPDVPGETDLEAAWRLDRAFEEARRRAIRLIPVLERGQPPDEFRRSSPYFKRAAPLARTVREFLSAGEPRAAFTRKLRYAAARWGGLASLGGWEMFDGPDLVSGEAEMPALLEWLDVMVRSLRACDPDHSVSVTLRTEASARGTARAAFDLLRGRPGRTSERTELDGASPRDTGGPSSAAPPTSSSKEPDAVRLLVGRALGLAGDDPPTVEAAFKATHDASAWADYLVLDVPAKPVHAALWSAAAGSRKSIFLGAGAPRRETEPLARFLSDASPPGELSDAFSFESAVCRIVGSRGREGALWWVTRARGEEPGRRSPGKPAVEDGREPKMLPVVRGVEFELDSLRPGRYRIEWWQTRDLGLLTTLEVRATDGVVALRVPPFASDLAGRLARIADVSPSSFGK